MYVILAMSMFNLKINGLVYCFYNSCKYNKNAKIYNLLENLLFFIKKCVGVINNRFSKKFECTFYI